MAALVAPGLFDSPATLEGPSLPSYSKIPMTRSSWSGSTLACGRICGVNHNSIWCLECLRSLVALWISILFESDPPTDYATFIVVDFLRLR